MEILSCISAFFSKTSGNNHINRSKTKHPASKMPYTKFTIASDFTKIELSEEFIMEIKSEEDFEPIFHKEFMDFLLSYKRNHIYWFKTKIISQLVNEIFDKWIIAIKIHPLSSEYFEERKAICNFFSNRSIRFKTQFQEKFISIWKNCHLFEEPERSAIHRSWVIWNIEHCDDCDKYEEANNITFY